MCADKNYKTEYNKLLNKMAGSYISNDEYDISTKDYKFVDMSTSDNSEYIKKHKKELYKIISKCFPPNTIDKREIAEYKKIMYKMLNHFVYFVEYDGAVIGTAMLSNNSYFKHDRRLRTYTKIIPDKSLLKDMHANKDVVYVELGGLCKNAKYKRVGEFILKNVQNISSEIYLVAESAYFKNNYESFVSGTGCVIDDKKYYEANMKLIEYYKKIGFTVIDNLYYSIKCGDGKYIILNVLHKKF
jgi:hypothetical protein